MRRLRVIPTAPLGDCYGTSPSRTCRHSIGTRAFDRPLHQGHPADRLGPRAAPRHRLCGPRRGSGVPKPGYMEGVAEAAQALGLPSNYIAELNSWNSRPRRGRERRRTCRPSSLGGSVEHIAPELVPAAEPSRFRRRWLETGPETSPYEPNRAHPDSRPGPGCRLQGLGPPSSSAAWPSRLGPNRRDGAVEAVMAGPEDAVAVMLKVLAQGPQGASVTEIEHLPDNGRVIVSDGFEFSRLPSVPICRPVRRPPSRQ